MKQIYIFILILISAICKASDEQALIAFKQFDPKIYEEALHVIRVNPLYKQDIEERTKGSIFSRYDEYNNLLFRAAQSSGFSEDHLYRDYPEVASHYLAGIAFFEDNKTLPEVYAVDTSEPIDGFDVFQEVPGIGDNLGYHMSWYNFNLFDFTHLDYPNRIYIRSCDGDPYLIAIYYITPRTSLVDPSTKEIYVIKLDPTPLNSKLIKHKSISLKKGHYPRGWNCLTDDLDQDRDYWGNNSDDFPKQVVSKIHATDREAPGKYVRHL